MKYSNPQIPEGINTTDRHPLREFLLLAGGALVLVLLLAWLVGGFGGRLARLLPFESEERLVPTDMLSGDAGPPLQYYLDDLAERVSSALDLPAGMQVRVHASGDDTFNAFATLGGHVLLFRGLLEALPNENALVMLMAHEIAHVRHRDPIVSIGRGAAIQLVVGLLFGDPNLAALGRAGIYTQLHFNRDMERSADADALRAVYAIYGHVAGAADLFSLIQQKRRHAGRGEPPAIFSSHPLDRQRLDAIADSVRQNGWADTGKVTPLPDAYPTWMADLARHGGAAE
ncbi:MAG: M48 family metallopeptidase [Chromatiaceae bacterium]|nr:M48 family metallopeptidase [Gammaproteobacteria bacterium]MCP5300929.1 M48 family metallopeptidase [Chromatiaceae bacterium]MCP5421598.1 M48 family metallopeptidase [Chromatiaceae bacterium]